MNWNLLLRRGPRRLKRLPIGVSQSEWEDRFKLMVDMCTQELGRRLLDVAKRYSMQVFAIALTLHLRATKRSGYSSLCLIWHRTRVSTQIRYSDRCLRAFDCSSRMLLR